MNDSAPQAGEAVLLDLSARQLRAFVLLAETLSYSKAGEMMHYSESGVYRLVARLEELVGRDLIERDGNHIRLTAEAIFILPTCRSILGEVERIASIRPANSRSRRLVVVAGPLTGPFVLPPYLRRYAELDPDTAVDMITAPPDDILKIVAAGQADIGVCGGLATRPRPPRMSVEPWRTEPYGLFMRTGLAVRQGVQMAIYTITGWGEPINRFRELLKSQQIEPAEVRIVTSAEVVKGACLAGLGYAFLPLSATELERTAGLFVEALPPEQRFSAPLCVCYISEPQPRPSVLRFLHVLTDSAQPPSEPIPSAAT